MIVWVSVAPSIDPSCRPKSLLCLGGVSWLRSNPSRKIPPRANASLVPVRAALWWRKDTLEWSKSPILPPAAVESSHFGVGRGPLTTRPGWVASPGRAGALGGGSGLLEGFARGRFARRHGARGRPTAHIRDRAGVRQSTPRRRKVKHPLARRHGDVSPSRIRRIHRRLDSTQKKCGAAPTVRSTRRRLH